MSREVWVKVWCQCGASIQSPLLRPVLGESALEAFVDDHSTANCLLRLVQVDDATGVEVHRPVAERYGGRSEVECGDVDPLAIASQAVMEESLERERLEQLREVLDRGAPGDWRDTRLVPSEAVDQAKEVPLRRQIADLGELFRQLESRVAGQAKLLAGTVERARKLEQLEQSMAFRVGALERGMDPES